MMMQRRSAQISDILGVLRNLIEHARHGKDDIGIIDSIKQG